MADTQTPPQTNEAAERLYDLIAALGRNGTVEVYETEREMVEAFDRVLADARQQGREEAIREAREQIAPLTGFKACREEVLDILDAIAAEHREDGARIRDFNERRAAMGLPALSEDEAGELLASNIAEHREDARP